MISGSFETIARVFKVLCVALLAYLGVLFVVKVDWPSVASHTFVPHITFSADYLMLLVAVLGTTISPYLFFWQSAHRIEELRDEPEGGDDAIALDTRSTANEEEKVRTSRGDVFTGMTFSNVVMFAIIVATATTLGRHGNHDIASAAEAASALRPIAGRLSTVLFAAGFVGAGFLAVPVLAGSGSAGFSGLLRRRWGFSRSPREAPVFYGLVFAGTVGGTALTLLGINAMKAARRGRPRQRPGGCAVPFRCDADLEGPRDHGRAPQRPSCPDARMVHRGPDGSGSDRSGGHRGCLSHPRSSASNAPALRCSIRACPAPGRMNVVTEGLDR